MTTLELKLTLPERLARQAKAAGLLKPEAIVSSKLIASTTGQKPARHLLLPTTRAPGQGWHVATIPH